MSIFNKFDESNLLVLGLFGLIGLTVFAGFSSLSFSGRANPTLEECTETRNTGQIFKANCEQIGNLADPDEEVWYAPDTSDDLPMGIHASDGWYRDFHIAFLEQRKQVDSSTINTRCRHDIGRGFTLCTDSNSTAETMKSSFSYTRDNSDESNSFEHIIEFRPRNGLNERIKSNIENSSCSVTLNLEDYDDRFQVKTFEGDLSASGTGLGCDIGVVRSGDVQEIGDPRLVQTNVKASFSFDMSFEPENTGSEEKDDGSSSIDDPEKPDRTEDLSIDERVVRFIGGLFGVDSWSSWTEGEPLF